MRNLRLLFFSSLLAPRTLARRRQLQVSPLSFRIDSDEIIRDHSVIGRRVRANRSMPSSTVIPVLIYPDVAKAVDWLCDAF